MSGGDARGWPGGRRCDSHMHTGRDAWPPRARGASSLLSCTQLCGVGYAGRLISRSAISQPACRPPRTHVHDQPNSHPYCRHMSTAQQALQLRAVCVHATTVSVRRPASTAVATATLNVDFWSFGLVCKATTGDSPPGEVCALHALCGVRDVTRVGGLQFYRAQKRYFRYIYERTADRRDRRVSAHALGPNEHCHT